jgi:hypothetical protein
MKINMSEESLKIWHAVLSLCRSSNYARVVVTFDGCGDSGQIEDMDFQFNDESAPKHPATRSVGVFDVREGSTYLDGRWEPVIKQRELTLEDAIEMVTYDILGATLGGWEIDNGMSGTITYYIPTGVIKCEYDEHTSNTVEGTFDINAETEEV